jgi:hypothetical protein
MSQTIARGMTHPIHRVEHFASTRIHPEPFPIVSQLSAEFRQPLAPLFVVPVHVGQFPKDGLPHPDRLARDAREM